MNEQIERKIKEVKESIVWYKQMVIQIIKEIKSNGGNVKSLCNQRDRYKDRLTRARNEFEHLKGKVS